MNTMNEYDIIIIGGGPGGYHAAHVAAGRGSSVLLIEREALGGTCLNWGCIPTKTLLNVAKHAAHGEKLTAMGLSGAQTYTHTRALEWKDEVVQILQGHVQSMLKKDKVMVVVGDARIQHLSADTKTVVVSGGDSGGGNNDTAYSAKHIILAGGVESYIPPIAGLDSAGARTSRDILSVEQVPRNLAIIGGGVIGIEFASLFAQLGSAVTIFEAMPEILPMIDANSVQTLKQILQTEQGIQFFCNTTVERIEKQSVMFSSADGTHDACPFDELLISVGRRTDLSPFADMGLAVSRTGIVVDEHTMTNIPGVYAIGDIAGSFQLAHVAYRMAEVAVDAIHGGRSSMRYHAVPMVVYTNPELASCGLTAAQAKEQGRDIVAASLPIAVSGRAVAEYGADVNGVCTIIADRHTATILGIHIVGPTASEIISTAAVILEAELRVHELAEIIFPHPTVAEVIHSVCAVLLRTMERA